MTHRAKRNRFTLLAITVVLPLASLPARAQNVDAGKAQFVTSCGTCHTAGKGEPARQGPNLWSVVGRKAGSVEGFKYSAALKGADFVWDEEKLDAWITNAQAIVPGSVMPYRQRDPDKRKAVIAYLKTLKE
jgi:cytochrome c